MSVLHVDEIKNLPHLSSCQSESFGTNTRSTVGTYMDIAPAYSSAVFTGWSTMSAGGSMAYSFNHPAGMCPICTGIGKVYQLIEDKILIPQNH